MSDKLNIVLNIFNTVVNKLNKTDQKVEGAILTFLQDKYYPAGDLPLFTMLLPRAIKLIFYFSITTIVLFIIKVLYPEKKIVTLTLISMLLTIGVLLTIIFLGFMQLLYE